VTAPTKAKDGWRGVSRQMLGAESVASPSGTMKPGTTRDPILTAQQEEAFREQVAREMYWGPDSLRGFAKRWLTEAREALFFGQYQMAARFTTLAADCQAKALELEARKLVKEAQGV
jgi:hypothetical protein